MAHVVLRGSELDGLVVDEPAASVRLLLPSSLGGELVIPEWSGNEFLLSDGSRPVIRTFTPYRCGGGALELLIVLHDGGAASTWAQHAGVGAEAAVSGPGRGYEIDPSGGSLHLFGDETAIPAMAQIVAEVPDASRVSAHVEVAHPAARLDLLSEVGAKWHVLPSGAPPGETLVQAAEAASLSPEDRVWAAGEAAAMQRIRRLLAAVEVPRRRATVRGYWKLREE